MDVEKEPWEVEMEKEWEIRDRVKGALCEYYGIDYYEVPPVKRSEIDGLVSIVIKIVEEFVGDK